ncbi:right-handed parallel beta-helix repeat-containing protein [Bacillus cereus]|uniref:right-handed parallel beta-helix repeat-containing protein n=1 Tax=Bacillus cereus TaxID=1396 RepID=UPI001BA828F1|nr:right-handed parallel beta-helix repeat-containing protein [Bacillus cereus]MBR9698632.1 hypothetical protein [Bacillus cereus]
MLNLKRMPDAWLQRVFRNNYNQNVTDIENHVNGITKTTAETLELQDKRISNLVLESGGDSNIEVADARIDANGESHDTIKDRLDSNQTLVEIKLNEHKERINNIAIDVTSFGARGDDLNNDSLSIQAAIDSLNGSGKLLFPKGTYFINELVFEKMTGLQIIGDGSAQTQLAILGDTPDKKVAFKGCKDVRIEGVTLQLYDSESVDKILFTEYDGVPCSDIVFRDCIINNNVNMKRTSGTITFWRNCFNVTFENCTFNDTNKPLKFDNNGVAVPDIATYRFLNCKFLGDTSLRAYRAIEFMGSGERNMSTVYVQNCIFENFDYQTVNLYHITSFVVTNNTFKNCKALVTSNYRGTSPTESAICWLDSSSIGTVSVCTGNTFKDCVGICIYLEEGSQTIISDNKFYNISKRPQGILAYDDGFGTLIEGYGAHCIIIVGGCVDVVISNNTFVNVVRAVLVCRRFAYSTIGSYYIKNIQIVNNTLNCSEVAFDLKEKIEDRVVVKGNRASGNNFPFVEIKRYGSYEPDSVQVLDNIIQGFSCVCRNSLNYGQGIMMNNYFQGNAFWEVDFRQKWVVRNNVWNNNGTVTVVDS